MEENRRGLLLLAEADFDFASFFVAEFLKLAPDWEVEQVANSQAVTKRLQQNPLPHALAVDLEIGDLSCPDLIQWIRSQESLEGLYVLVLSREKNPEEYAHCIALGANHFLDNGALLSDLRIELQRLKATGEAPRVSGGA